MSRVREFLLQRAKETAKVFPLERLPPGQPSPAPVAPAKKPGAPRPQAKPGRAPAARPSGQPGSAAQAVAAQRQPPPGDAAAVWEPGPVTAVSGSAGPLPPASALVAPLPEMTQLPRGRRPPTPAAAVDLAEAAAAASAPPVARRPAAPGAAAVAAVPAATSGPTAREPGKVPVYLKRRQAEMAEERRRAAAPPSVVAPPGFRLVPEAERLISLDVLRKRREEVEAALQRLPFRIETAGQRKREKEALEQLAHMDRLLMMFGNVHVFVPEDVPPLGMRADAAVEAGACEVPAPRQQALPPLPVAASAAGKLPPPGLREMPRPERLRLVR